jgi:hypothetical protein
VKQRGLYEYDSLNAWHFVNRAEPKRAAIVDSSTVSYWCIYCY